MQAELESTKLKKILSSDGQNRLKTDDQTKAKNKKMTT